MTDMILGCAFRVATAEQPSARVVEEAVRLFRASHSGIGCTVHGMLAGSDRFSRRVPISPRSLQELAVDIGGDVYSDLTAYAGHPRAPRGMLTVQLNSQANNCRQVLLTADVAIASLEQQVALAESLWQLFAPEHAELVVGATYGDVLGELTGIPVADWRSKSNPLHEIRQRRLASKQRPGLAGWTTFISPEMVARLGGRDAVVARAPVSSMRPLARGVALVLSPEPLALEDGDYASRVTAVDDFLDGASL